MLLTLCGTEWHTMAQSMAFYGTEWHAMAQSSILWHSVAYYGI